MSKQTTVVNFMGKYNITNGVGAGFEVCYMEKVINSTNPWQRVQPLENALPGFLWQLATIIFMTRAIMFIGKPFRLPRFFYEVVAGILLGPSGLGSIAGMFLSRFEGVLVLETIGSLGLTYYMFVVGLEMDLSPILKIGKEALSYAVAGVFVPMAGGALLYCLVTPIDTQTLAGYAFWTITLTVTSFPDLARILSDLKLLHTDLGKTVLLVSIINDNFAGILLLIALSTFGHMPITILSPVPAICCVVVFWWAIRPTVHYVIRWKELRDDSPTSEERYNDGHVHFILALVPLCGFLTELCGIHSMVGGFLLGLIIPGGELGTRIMEKTEDFVVGILLPPIFLITGIRTNFGIMLSVDPVIVIAVVILACLLKIAAAVVTSLFFRTPLRQALVLGVLMNTKGVLAIIILNEGRGLQLFDQRQFATMICALLLMTACVRLVEYLNSWSKSQRVHFRRSLEKAKGDVNLRILACVHSGKTVNGIVNLLRMSNPTIKSPMTVFAVHLAELTRGTSAMLIFHDRAKTGTAESTSGGHNTREIASAEQIVTAFEALANERPGVVVNPLTIVSPYNTMHEDISDFSYSKFATLIILPFHKQSGNEDESTNDLMNYQQVTQNVLASAPCSVAILVDRGLASFSAVLMSNSDQSTSSSSVTHCNIAMLFFGGDDDREALAFSKRMSGSPGIKLTVIRFLAGKEAVQSILQNIPKQHEQMLADVEQQMQQDYECVNEFRFRTMYDRSVTYTEKQVGEADQVLESIRLFYDEFDLYVVGREQGLISPLTKGLSDWNEYPELGTIGELLVSSDFGTDASVLVVQQCPPPPPGSASKKRSAFVNHRKKDDYSDD